MPATPQPLTTFERVRNIGVVAVLALGFALTLAIFAEGTWARPACQAYASSRQLTYAGLEYPSAPPGVPGRRAAACLFVSSGGSGGSQVTSIPFDDVAPSRRTATLVEVLTSPLLTAPLLIVIFIFLLYQVYGAMGIR